MKKVLSTSLIAGVLLVPQLVGAAELKSGTLTKPSNEAPTTIVKEYAKAKGKLVICVAQDKAWKDFAAKSDHLVTVFPLTEALGIYSEAFKDADLADKIVELWLDGKEPKFEEAVRDAIIERLTYVDYDVEANCSVEFEAEPMDAQLKEILMGTLTNPVVLTADDDTVTFSIEVNIKADFEALFNFSIWDSVDRESVGMGSEYVRTTADVPVHLTIVADRDVTDGVAFSEIEVSQKTFTVDFGYVDAFPAEDPDYD
jgi:hypothetical protein